MRGAIRDRLFVWFQHALPHHGLSRLTLAATRVRTPWFRNLLIRGFLALFALAVLANWIDKRKRKKANARIAAPFSFLVETRFRQR